MSAKPLLRNCLGIATVLAIIFFYLSRGFDLLTTASALLLITLAIVTAIDKYRTRRAQANSKMHDMESHIPSDEGDETVWPPAPHDPNWSEAQFAFWTAPMNVFAKKEILLYIIIVAVLSVLALSCALLIRKSFPQGRQAFSRAKMGNKKAYFLWLFTSCFVYLPLIALGEFEILHHIHVSVLVTELNITFSTMNLMITLVSIPLAVGGEILLLFLFIRNTAAPPCLDHTPPTDHSSLEVWPPAPHDPG